MGNKSKRGPTPDLAGAQQAMQFVQGQYEQALVRALGAERQLQESIHALKAISLHEGGEYLIPVAFLEQAESVIGVRFESRGDDGLAMILVEGEEEDGD